MYHKQDLVSYPNNLMTESLPLGISVKVARVISILIMINTPLATKRLQGIDE